MLESHSTKIAFRKLAAVTRSGTVLPFHSQRQQRGWSRLWAEEELQEL